MRVSLPFLLFFTLFLSVHSSAQLNVTMDCGFDMEITALDKQLTGRIKAKDGNNSSYLTSVKWYNGKNNQLLGTGAYINSELPEYGTYNIVARYQTATIGGQLGCAAELSQFLIISEPECNQNIPYDPNSFCPNVYAPVCGCDGNIYASECDAMLSGISQWWAGECNNQPPSITCGSTDLGIEVISGGPSEGYWVKFTNLASGNFTNIQLDFGDGCQIYQAAQWTSKLHHYNAGGIFQATLTAWNINQSGCVSSVTRTFATDALSLTEATLLYNPDYVMPGDANGDGVANAYDLLYIGKGYGAPGSPRPEASIDWSPQYAPNWLLQTPDGINYKHLDANGDGFVNEFDTEPLEIHYQPLPHTLCAALPDAPPIYTQILQDTVVLDVNNPQDLDVEVELLVGSPQQPVFGLYGLAATVRYPEMLDHDPIMLYDPSFFGSGNYVLSIGRDFHPFQQYDMGVVRKNGTGTNGYGPVAKIKFKADYIIIIDIIDREQQNIIPVTFPVQGIKAIDSDGNQIHLNPPSVPDTLWIKVEGVTPTKNTSVDKVLSLSPNPTKGQFTLRTDGNISLVRLFDLAGKEVLAETEINGATATVNTSQLPLGQYSVLAQTDQGLVYGKVQVAE